jgi:AraC family transcriptional regulator of adaptative response / DNA-3-methyladenine glycosylase II
MTSDFNARYTALASRDPRFDGVFYVGVTSTGIYCRPVCTARTPKAANCRFFESAVAAEKANFRPCLRCRPELAPGNAPVDDAHRIASLIARRIDEGMLDDGAGLETVAARFGWSSRQIRRMLQRELGVSPMDLVLTRRLLLAKQLLTETTLPISEVVFASGFSSVRRFNDAFNGRYGIPPTQFRKATPDVRSAAAPTDTFTLQLSYRPPFDWGEMLAFLAARAMRGVEAIDGDAYGRTVRLGAHTGWVSVRHAPARRALLVELPHSLTPVLPALLGRLRHLFDLSARPDVIAAHLSLDPVLGDSVARHPGLRVPGAFDGFELGVRAILGQQITVAAATTIAGRLAAALGEPVATPRAGLDRLAPTAERVARVLTADVAALGIVRARAESIVALAREMASGRLVLEPGAQPDETIARLTALPGVGPWTAQYIAMRATRWPDAFPKEDVAARKALGGVSAAAAEAASQRWRPWRSYALLHLWQTASRDAARPRGSVLSTLAETPRAPARAPRPANAARARRRAPSGG